MNTKPGLDPEIDPGLEEMLRGMQRSVRRDPAKTARAREAFLAEARSMAPRVSNLKLSRLNRWQQRFGAFGLITRKEKRPVFNLVMTVLLVLGAVFGGGATAVAASQNAQPDDALYIVKTLSEDVRMDVAADPQARLDLALQYTARRAAETQTMLAAQGEVPDSLMLRFENQLQQALMLAAGMQDGEALQALERVRDQARMQDQTMAQLQLQMATAIQTRTRVRTMLQAQELLAQAGIEDPTWLRQELRQGNGNPTMGRNAVNGSPVAPDSTMGNGNPSPNGQPMPDSTMGNGSPSPNDQSVPGSGNGPGTSANPVPGAGNGPGPGTGDCVECTGQPMNGGSGGGNGSQSGGGDGGRGGSGMGGSGGGIGIWPTPTPIVQN